jgi:hypothetical protein
MPRRKYLPCPFGMRQKWSVGNSVRAKPDCSVVINNALAIERRGGRCCGGIAHGVLAEHWDVQQDGATSERLVAKRLPMFGEKFTE